MFLPATKLRVVKSTHVGKKTNIKAGSLLYIVKQGPMFVLNNQYFNDTNEPELIVMPAKAAITRYGNEKSRRLEVKPLNLVVPVKWRDDNNVNARLKRIMTTVGKEENHLNNVWATNKQGKFRKGLPYVIVRPTLEEVNPCISQEDLTAWAFSLINAVCHHQHRSFRLNMYRTLMISSINEALPGIGAYIHYNNGSLICEHIKEVGRCLENIKEDPVAMNKFMTWAGAQKALLLRKILNTDLAIYSSKQKIISKITTTNFRQFTAAPTSDKWKDLRHYDNTKHNLIRYLWLTSINKLPTYFESDSSKGVVSWAKALLDVKK